MLNNTESPGKFGNPDRRIFCNLSGDRFAFPKQIVNDEFEKTTPDAIIAFFFYALRLLHVCAGRHTLFL